MTQGQKKLKLSSGQALTRKNFPVEVHKIDLLNDIYAPNVQKSLSLQLLSGLAGDFSDCLETF